MDFPFLEEDRLETHISIKMLQHLLWSDTLKVSYSPVLASCENWCSVAPSTCLGGDESKRDKNLAESVVMNRGKGIRALYDITKGDVQNFVFSHSLSE